MIPTMTSQGDTLQETLQHMRLCELHFTGPNYSDMRMLMLESVKSVKGVLEKTISQQPRCNPLQWKNLFNSGLGHYWGNFPAVIKATPLHLKFYKLFHPVERSSSTQTGERSGSH